MKVFAPNYYKKFSCIADKCKHSCCVGWEIDIDKETYEAYKSNDTDFGKRLNNNIVFNDDYACFKLAENDRCPFLNENNLCEIILNIGEGSLCQICSDHPRFRNFYGDRTEIGLGLTCEEASRIILNENSPFSLVEIEDDNKSEAIYDDETEFFNIRNEIYNIIEGEKRFEAITNALIDKFNVELPALSTSEWVDTYLNLERLDNEWSKMLEELKSSDNVQIAKPYSNEKALKNLLIYFIYRHLGESICDSCFNGRLLFSIISCYIISALCNIGYNIEDVARMYSSEIEYSDENLNNLIEFLQSKSLEV